jgi:hypothetical protein
VVGLDEPERPELIHEEVHTRPGRADDFSELLLGDRGKLTNAAKGPGTKLARFRRGVLGQKAAERSFPNRIVHNRFWHENAWL